MRSSRFSPPAWGWSGDWKGAGAQCLVLPTRVGMVRKLLVLSQAGIGSPHPRGDGPTILSAQDGDVGFSPPAWGWSALSAQPGCHTCVLPTRVGMVRVCRLVPSRFASSPHPRGDGPVANNPLTFAVEFSPPAWGWSGMIWQSRRITKVLPTRVGMVRLEPSESSRP